MLMTSTESNSTRTDPTVSNGGLTRRAVASVAVTMALLAALVWTFRPLGSNFVPARLQPVPMGAVVLFGMTATALTATLTISDALNGYMSPTDRKSVV